MPKKGLTIWCRSCKILNVRRELITHAWTDREASNITPFTRFRACRKGPKNRAVSGVGTGGSIALFTALQQDSAICSQSAEVCGRSGASFFHRPPNRSPAKRVRFGKEEGGSGYAALPALSETGKAEWSELLLTQFRKAAANQVLAQDLWAETGQNR